MRAYYSDDFVTLYHGDCRDVLPSLDMGACEAVITDPPYGTEGEAGGYGRRQLYDKGDGMGRRIVGDKDLATLTEALPLMMRVAVPHSWWALFCSGKNRGEVERILPKGLAPFGEVIWDKGVPGLGRAIRYAHEAILVCRRGGPAHGADALLSVQRVSAERVRAGDEHPHRKPVLLLRRLVRWACPNDGVVLDPFAGCGPVAVACVAEGRRYVGVEIDEAYCETAAMRLREARTNGPLFDDTQADLMDLSA